MNQVDDRSVNGRPLFEAPNHVGITVRDLDAEVEFYTRLFGVESTRRRTYDSQYTAEQTGYPSARLDVAMIKTPNSDLKLELIAYEYPIGKQIDVETCNPGTWHLCLETPEIEAAFDRMTALGASPRSSCPVVVTSGPNAGGKVAYLRDPEGLTIELFERPASNRSWEGGER